MATTPTPCSVLQALALALLLAPAAVHAQEELEESPEEIMAREFATGTTGDEAAARSRDPETDPDADRQARALFERGRASYEDGAYRDAWDDFHKAYMLSKRPQLLYNVGQAADRLRLDRQALDAFRLYLKKLPDADNRREVENRIAALEQRVEAEDAADTRPDDGETQDPDFFDEGDDDGAAAAAGAHEQPSRTGWALRGSVGLGFFGDAVSGTGISDATLTSSTAGVQLGVGYGLAPRLVIGLGLLLDSGLSPSVEVGPAKRDIDGASLFSAHVFADYYFAPRKHGWHLLGGLGIATLGVSDSSTLIGNQDVSGGALLVAGGYEWPFGQEWAIGVLGRILLARMSKAEQTHVLFSPNVAFTGIWY